MKQKPRIIKPGEALPPEQDTSIVDVIQHLGEVHNNAYAQFQLFRGKASARLDTMQRTLKKLFPEFEETYLMMWNAVKLETTLLACEAARQAGDLDSYTRLHKQQQELRDSAIKEDWLDLYNETVTATHEKIRNDGEVKTLTLEKFEEDLEEAKAESPLSADDLEEV